MKKSRRQKHQRKRRQSHKIHAIQGGTLGETFDHFGNVMEGAKICDSVIHLIKIVNQSNEFILFCKKIDTASISGKGKISPLLIDKLNSRMTALTNDMNEISGNNVITTVVRQAIQLFSSDKKFGNEMTKLLAIIPDTTLKEIMKPAVRSSTFAAVASGIYNVYNGSKIVLWSEWYHNEISEKLNNLMATVTEIIGLYTLPILSVALSADDKHDDSSYVVVTPTPLDNPYITRPKTAALDLSNS